MNSIKDIEFQSDTNKKPIIKITFSDGSLVEFKYNTLSQAIYEFIGISVIYDFKITSDGLKSLNNLLYGNKKPFSRLL